MFAPDPRTKSIAAALVRFRSKCRFEPETGCVVWTGGKSKGRGHHVPYGVFWFDNARWFAHRWAAKFIHGLDIDGLQVDHCCPVPIKPNTLCVEHLQGVTLRTNRLLQDQRKRFIHLQVGLLNYEDVYGPMLPEDEDQIPFYEPPSWLDLRGDRNERCPF